MYWNQLYRSYIQYIYLFVQIGEIDDLNEEEIKISIR
jgi:hypothetical protein